MICLLIVLVCSSFPMGTANTTFQRSRNSTISQGLGGSSSTLETGLFSLFFIIIFITATLGNLLVLIAIYTTNNLRTTSNYLLANLALADFLQGFISMPLRTAESIAIHQDLTVLCQVALPVSILFGSTSNLNILFISIDRFVAIFFPYFYLRVVTPRAIFSVIIMTWFLMVVFAFAPTAGLGSLTPEGPVMMCRFPIFLTKSYITSLYIIVHGIPVITVIIIYGFILRASLLHARRIHVQQQSVGQNSVTDRDEATGNSTVSDTKTTSVHKNTAKQMKAARIVSYVLGFFILLVAPIVLVDVIEMLGGPNAPGQFVKVAVCMIYTNHCVNVFVYAGCNREFRRAFIKILKAARNFICCCQRNI